MEMWNTVKKRKKERDKRNKGGGINTAARLLFLTDLKENFSLEGKGP